MRISTTSSTLTALCCLQLASWAGSSAANDACAEALEATFREGAPRDRFVFENVGQSDIARITIDMDGSRGRLYFDTSASGDGVEVFQPFRVEASDASLTAMPEPDDGDTQIVLDFKRFPAGASFTFSIDVDDRLTDSSLGQIRVAGAEIDGAQLDIMFRSADGESTSHSTVFQQASARSEVCSK